MNLSTQFRSLFSETALDALDRAAANCPPGRPVDTLDVFLALTEVDAGADWNRIWMALRPLERSAAGRYQDPLPHADDSWNGSPVTETCARATRAAMALADRPDQGLPVPAGILALCLVGLPTTAASRALGATSEPGHALLLDRVQETLVGAHHSDIRRVLADCLTRSGQGEPGGPEDEEPDVRRFLDYQAAQFEALIDVLNQFLRADAPDRSGALLEEHPELLSPVFDTIIASSIDSAEQAGDSGEAVRLRERQRFLASYRQLIDRPLREIAGEERDRPDDAPASAAMGEPADTSRSPRSSQRSGPSALEARLRQLQASPDPGQVLDPAALGEAAEALASAADLRADAQLLAMVGALHYLRWMAEPQDQVELMVGMALFAGLLGGRSRLDRRRRLAAPPVRKFLARERRQQVRPGTPPASKALRAFLAARRPGERAWAELLWQLSLLLYHQYQEQRQTLVLSEAIELLRHAVRMTPPDDPEYPRRATSLGTWQLVRQNETRQPADLDGALEILHHTGAALPGDGNWRTSLFAALGSAFHELFNLDNDLDALNAAIRTHRRALRDSSADDPGYGRLALRLGAALLRHYDRTRQPDSLTEAIEQLQAAEACSARHAERSPAVLAAQHNNLSIAFRARYERTKDEQDLDEAIAAGERAVSAAEDPADQAAAHSTVGIARLARYVRYAIPRPANFVDPGFAESLLSDFLDDALMDLRTAVALTPVDDPGHATSLANLGISLQQAHAAGAPDKILREAIVAFGNAADSPAGAPSVRLRAGLAAGRLAADRRDWRKAAARMGAAIDLLEAAVPRGLRREDREHQLVYLRDLGPDAAACAWRAGDPKRAVDLFERGRGVLLAQELDTPAELTRLREHDEKLADDFAALRLKVERAGRGDLFSNVNDWTAQTAAEQRRAVLSEWDALLSRIRAEPGFAEFPRPRRQDSLLALGDEGPVALLNVSKYGSAAFLIHDGSMSGIELPGLTPAKARAMVTELLTATDREIVDPADDAQGRLNYLLGWLWDAVTGPVLDHLQITARLDPDAEDGPRIWWCPSGLLSFLPLHAAGRHDTRFDASPQTVMDRVISSYIPTLGMLEHARRVPEPTAGSMLIVAPGNAGTGGLPQERAATAGRAAVRVLADGAATPAAVLAALPSRNRVYFACHAASDLNDPSSGYLELHNREPLPVAKVAGLRLSHAEFAFLGACSTYQGGTALADEAIHLGGAFHLAGYRHVVATLWRIKDTPAAARVTAAVGEGIAGPVGVAATAVSLHRATRQARDRAPGAPSLWAPYVHSGS